jgi:hypothetical protein
MKKAMVLVAMGLSLTGLASAIGDVKSGTATTPLKLIVNNFCQLANVGGVTSDTFNQSYSQINLGTINAVTNNSVPDTLVAAADCNKGTNLDVVFPSAVTLTSGSNSLTINNTATSGPWSSSNPFTMTFKDGSYTNTYIDSRYEYHNYSASFKVGGSTGLGNGAWSVPGGTYTGDLVITYSYTE